MTSPTQLSQLLVLLGDAILQMESWNKQTTPQQQAAVLADITAKIKATEGLSASEQQEMIELSTMLLPSLWTWGQKAVSSVEGETRSLWVKLTGCCK